MKKLYLTVNPFGGLKKGPKILKKVLPLFENKNIELTVIETEYAGHNKKIAMDVDMSGYDGFCCIGGDGTLSEVINGQMNRKDLLKFPIGLITGGTGNSFMHDLECLDPLDYSSEGGVNYLAYIIGKGKYNKKYYCLNCIKNILEKKEN